MPTVRTKNHLGSVVELQVSDDMLDTLRGKVRNDELVSVDVIGEDAPDLVEVPVQYRPRPAAVLNVGDDKPEEPVVVVDERNTHPGQVVPDDTDTGLDALRAEYEEVFGEAPHHAKREATLRKEIDAKRSGD